MGIIVKLAVSNICFPTNDQDYNYKKLIEFGINRIEAAPNLIFPSSENSLTPSLGEKKHALELLSCNEIKIVSMQSVLYGKNCESFFNGEEQKKNFIHLMKDAIELAGEMNIPNIVFGCPKERRIPETMCLENALDIAYSVFFEIGNYAKTAGTVVGMETVPEIYGTNFLNRHKHTSDFVHTLNHSNIKISFDLGAYQYGDSDRRLEDIISQDFEWINHVHLSNPQLSIFNEDLEAVNELFKCLFKNNYMHVCSIEQTKQCSQAEYECSVNRICSIFS